MLIKYVTIRHSLPCNFSEITTILVHKRSKSTFGHTCNYLLVLLMRDYQFLKPLLKPTSICVLAQEVFIRLRLKITQYTTRRHTLYTGQAYSFICRPVWLSLPSRVCGVFEQTSSNNVFAQLFSRDFNKSSSYTLLLVACMGRATTQLLKNAYSRLFLESAYLSAKSSFEFGQIWPGDIFDAQIIQIRRRPEDDIPHSWNTYLPTPFLYAIN